MLAEGRGNFKWRAKQKIRDGRRIGCGVVLKAEGTLKKNEMTEFIYIYRIHFMYFLYQYQLLKANNYITPLTLRRDNEIYSMSCI